MIKCKRINKSDKGWIEHTNELVNALIREWAYIWKRKVGWVIARKLSSLTFLVIDRKIDFEISLGLHWLRIIFSSWGIFFRCEQFVVVRNTIRQYKTYLKSFQDADHTIKQKTALWLISHFPFIPYLCREQALFKFVKLCY